MMTDIIQELTTVKKRSEIAYEQVLSWSTGSAENQKVACGSHQIQYRVEHINKYKQKNNTFDRVKST